MNGITLTGILEATIGQALLLVLIVLSYLIWQTWVRVRDFTADARDLGLERRAEQLEREARRCRSRLDRCKNT